MAPPKRKSGGGRTTPKGTRPGEQRYANPEKNEDGVEASSRYTPPVPESYKLPNPYVPYIMVGLLVAGMVIIILRNLVWQDSLILMLAGLGCILGGLFAATKWR